MSFDGTLALLIKLKQQDELFVALSPPFSVSFDVDRDLLGDLLEEYRISEPNFRRFAHQVGAMLAAILNGSDESFASHISDEDADVTGGPVGKDEIQVAVTQVKAGLHDSHLQKRYDLKRSSKAPSFTDVDWDIKVKHFDAKLGDFTPFPYATCRLSYQRDFEDSPFALFGGKTFDSVQINFSIDEINYLSKVLGRVRERLQELEENGA